MHYSYLSIYNYCCPVPDGNQRNFDPKIQVFGIKLRARLISTFEVNGSGQVRTFYRYSRDNGIEIPLIFESKWIILAENHVSIRVCTVHHIIFLNNICFSESIPERKNSHVSRSYRIKYPSLHKFFLVGSSFGDEIFYITYLPILYWCFEHYTGARIVQVSL